MSRLVARILLSIFMFPLAALLYVVSAVVADRYLVNVYTRRSINWFAWADVVTGLGIALYWCLLWRSAVRWARWRVTSTLVTFLLAGLAGVGSNLLATNTVSRDGDFGAFAGGVLAIMLWLVATVFLWRETGAERAARLGGGGSTVACPTCGYNLTGLGEARCPECGSRFTLDELLAAQPTRVAAELE